MKSLIGRLLIMGLWVVSLMGMLVHSRMDDVVRDRLPVLFYPLLLAWMLVFPVVGGLYCGIRHLGYGNRISRLLMFTAIPSGIVFLYNARSWQIVPGPFDSESRASVLLWLFMLGMMAGCTFATALLGKLFRKNWVLCRDEATAKSPLILISFFGWLTAIAVILQFTTWIMGSWFIDEFVISGLAGLVAGIVLQLLIILPYLARLVGTPNPWTWGLFWVSFPGLLLIGLSWLVIQPWLENPGPGSMIQFYQASVVITATTACCFFAMLGCLALGYRWSGWLVVDDFASRSTGPSSGKVVERGSRACGRLLLTARICLIGVLAYSIAWVGSHVYMFVSQPDASVCRRNYLSGFVGQPIDAQSIGEASQLLFGDGSVGKSAIAIWSGLGSEDFQGVVDMGQWPQSDELFLVVEQTSFAFKPVGTRSIDRIGACLSQLDRDGHVKLLMSIPWDRNWFPVAAVWLDRLEPGLQAVHSLIPKLVSNPDLRASGGTILQPVERFLLHEFPDQCLFAAMNDLGEGRPKKALERLRDLDSLMSWRFGESPVSSNVELCRAILAIAPHLADNKGLEEGERESVKSLVDRIANAELNLRELKTSFALKTSRMAVDLLDEKQDSFRAICIGRARTETLLKDHLANMPRIIDWREVGRQSRHHYDRIAEILDNSAGAHDLLKKLNDEGDRLMTVIQFTEVPATQVLAVVGFPTARARWLDDESIVANRTLIGLVVRRNTIAAKARMLQIATALKAWRKESGSWPDNLAVLLDRHIDILPLDPFTGKAFVYKKKADAFELYSMGENQLSELTHDIFDASAIGNDDVVFDDVTTIPEQMLLGLEALDNPNPVFIPRFFGGLRFLPRW